MFRKFALGLALLGMSGCFDIESGMTFRTDGMVDGSSTITIERMMYDMASMGDEPFCADGELVEGQTTVSCVFQEQLTLAEAIEKSNASNEVMTDTPDVPRFKMEEVSPGVVVLEMPIGSIMAEAEMPQEEGMPDPMAMMQMMGIDLTEKEMHFWVQARIILESSQPITQEGTYTEFRLPVADVFARTVPEDLNFRVVLQYN